MPRSVSIVMHEKFPITQVQPHWALEPEEMGSKRKFWYRPDGRNRRRWLFKYPQTGTGQHWAEKLAAEVAGLLGIRHAPVELAVFNGEPGSITRSFTVDGLELVHGNQILQAFVRGYNPAKRFRQADHTMNKILMALDRIFSNDTAKQKAKSQFAEYLVLDALIGNTDRHHENWGVLRERRDGAWYGLLAPSFDHASSLGRELVDDRRARLLEEDRVGAYVERGRGAIYWSPEDIRGSSPLALVRRATLEYPHLLRPAMAQIDRLDGNVDNLIGRIPDGWMSCLEMEFATKMIHYSLDKLREVVG